MKKDRLAPKTYIAEMVPQFKNSSRESKPVSCAHMFEWKCNSFGQVAFENKTTHCLFVLQAI